MFAGTFRDLDTWQVAMDLAETIYSVATRMPNDERYELSRQIRRAAVSVPSNIAEGHATRLHGRYRHHLRLAKGSAAELSTQLELACRFGYIDQREWETLEKQMLRLNQLLNGTMRNVSRQMGERES